MVRSLGFIKGCPQNPGYVPVPVMSPIIGLYWSLFIWIGLCYYPDWTRILDWSNTVQAGPMVWLGLEYNATEGD